jgi:choline dehydrogenase-like flavoprotein
MSLKRVSGGGARNVVANRLTENPNFSVLVLEAGAETSVEWFFGRKEMIC